MVSCCSSLVILDTPASKQNCFLSNEHNLTTQLLYKVPSVTGLHRDSQNSDRHMYLGCNVYFSPVLATVSQHENYLMESLGLL